MRLILKPSIKDELDKMIADAVRKGREIEAIEMTRDEFEKLYSECFNTIFVYKVTNGQSSHHNYNDIPIKLLDV